ncbi:MAG: hypothetical protein ACK5WH_14725 [Hyphomonadaceae bacterium]
MKELVLAFLIYACGRLGLRFFEGKPLEIESTGFVLVGSIGFAIVFYVMNQMFKRIHLWVGRYYAKLHEKA